MQTIKNIFVGFLVSFIGSIPLGYLNVVGFELYKRFGINHTVFYLLGVILIEFFVIFFTLIFAKKIINKSKFIKIIESFSIVFMFVLAYVFYSNGNEPKSIELFNEIYLDTTPFVLGVFLSCTNFIQIPFWTSWNLYLLHGKYIEISHSRKYFYVFGTITGTFFGMLVLILSLNFLTIQADFFSKYLMKIIIPLVFVGLGFFQTIKFYNKYFK